MNLDVSDEEFVLEPVKRAGVFERLLEGSASRKELEKALDVSRATLHRIVTFLGEHDLVVEDDDVSLTPLGRIVAREVTGYVDRMDAAGKLAPLLNESDFEAVSTPLDLSLLEDARVTLPKSGQPQLPAQRVVDIVDDAAFVRGFGPVVMPIYVDVFHRRITDGMQAELLVEPDVMEGLEGPYQEALAESLSSGNLDIAIHDALPFGLVITDSVVGLLGYDHDDVLRIFVEADGAGLREWADAVYEEYREEALAFGEPSADGV